MILEVADIRIRPGHEAEFEAATSIAFSSIFPKADGFLGYEVRRSIESPDRYILLLQWRCLEDHTVGFRGSALFGEWRALVSGHFAQAPFVEHCVLVSSSRVSLA